MKNKDIHKDLSQREIRDFLAQEITDSRKGGMLSVKYVEEQIERFQKLLKYAKKLESIEQIIEDKNWAEWDISDYVSYKRETYFSFIGTKNEYYELLESLGKEDEE